MLITSPFQCALPVSLLGAAPLTVVRDRHAGWRPAATERHAIVTRAVERDPLVPRPRAEFG